MKPTITLHTLKYAKADLENAPPADRNFYLMASGVANDLQMLSKTLAVILDNEVGAEQAIVKQGNSAFSMLVLRMLAGRLHEGWNLLSKFSKLVKSKYVPAMTPEEQDAYGSLLKYFNPTGTSAYISKIRDKIAFHSLLEDVESAFETLDPTVELGDYLHAQIGNSLYYTTEILQFETLKNICGSKTHAEALHQLIYDTQLQTSHFNDVIYGFSLIFFKLYIPMAIENLRNDSDTIVVGRFEDLQLCYFTELPQHSTD